MNNYRWNVPGKANNIKEVLQYIMKERNYDRDQMLTFIKEQQETHSPFLFEDMKFVVNKINVAIEKKQKILIYGDYDCDGITSTYVMFRGLKQIGANVIYKLPHRVKDGYGLKKSAIDYAKENNIDLIITVDNGIAAPEAVKYAQQNNIDVIVTDHHEPQEVLPDCLIINPVTSKSYPFDGLCGCGVAFKVVTALIENFEDTDLYNHLLEIVAIGTVADAMDLIDENRTFVVEGLKRLQNTTNVGIRELFILAELDGKKIDVDTIGFFIGPNLNATGRLDTPNIALDLLLSDDSFEANKHAKKILKLNDLRKDIQKKVVENLVVNEDDSCVVSLIDNVNAGVAGIIASKVVDTYQKPCFILHEGHGNKDILSGSGRTFSDFSIINCVINNKHIVEGGGGHAGACGVAIKTENLQLFKEACNKEYNSWIAENPEALYPTISVTCEVDLQNVNKKLISNIDRLKPFGSGNPQPKFISRNVTVDKARIVGKNKNVLQFTACQGFCNIPCVAFENVKNKFSELGNPKNVDILYGIGLNEWPVGTFNVQLSIIDIIESK